MYAHTKPDQGPLTPPGDSHLPTTTNALLELRDWLVEEKVTFVVLEATGDYWRGTYYLLEDTLNVILVNRSGDAPLRRRD